jgi:LysM repeat protein
MKFKNILIVPVLMLSISTSAYSMRDSIGVENLEGKKLILHKVEPKETYYSLSRKYNVTPRSIIDYNNNTPLSIGQIVKIPTNINYTDKPVSFGQGNNPSGQKRESTHVVQLKETFYSIANKYNMKVEELKELNRLKTNNLSIGQTLKVWVPDDTKPSEAVIKQTTEIKNQTVNPTNSTTSSTNKIRFVDSTDSNSGIHIPKNKYGITEKNEKGVAVWIDDANLDSSKSYALHSLAPVGTIIKITNPMTNRSVFAKVVGKYTENENTKDVIIVITKAASESLGALDKRFLVNITYGLPNEQ